MKFLFERALRISHVLQISIERPYLPLCVEQLLFLLPASLLLLPQPHLQLLNLVPIDDLLALVQAHLALQIHILLFEHVPFDCILFGH